jgi:hypothetical protein
MEKLMLEERELYLESHPTKGNGYYTRDLPTQYGVLSDLRVPRVRQGDFHPKLIPYRRHTSLELSEAILALYASGASTRDISRFLESVYGTFYSPQSISRLTQVVEVLWARGGGEARILSVSPGDEKLLKIRLRGFGEMQMGSCHAFEISLKARARSSPVHPLDRPHSLRPVPVGHISSPSPRHKVFLRASRNHFPGLLGPIPQPRSRPHLPGRLFRIPVRPIFYSCG